MMKRMEDGEGEHLSLLSLFFLYPEGSNLWVIPVDTFLCPSDHVLQDLVPLVHKTPAPEEDAFVHQGCGFGSHQGSETGT